jgi:TusA-related sulfurtransferase
VPGGEELMRGVLSGGLLAFLCACAVAQESPTAEHSRQDGVDQRGDHVMGFSHDKSTHHFHLLKDGGEIVVTADDPKDKKSIDQIQMHMSHLVGMCSNGNFKAPMLIHGSNPPGVATMIRLKSDIRYTVSELPQGAVMRIETSSPETTDAVHAFLLFQIIDHKTGDSPVIGESKSDSSLRSQ